MPPAVPQIARPGSRLVRTPRRTLVLYAVAMVVPTLALLLLGIQAVSNQRVAIARLSTANRRLLEARVADLVGQRIRDEAKACLEEAAGDRALDLMPDTPESIRAIRQRLESIAARHPIARSTFLMDRGGSVLAPKTDPLFPAAAASYLAGEPPSTRARIQALLDQGDAFEREGQLGRARAAYGSAYDAATTARGRAAALVRVARSEQRLGQADKAAVAYRTLVEQFGDLYDAIGRPYALAAGVELARLSLANTGAFPEPGLLGTLTHDLAEGRWELSADEADYFLEQLTAAGPGGRGPPGASGFQSRYLESLRTAREIRDQFEPRPSLAAGQIYEAALADGSLGVFYAEAAPSRTAAIVGLTVDVAYVGTRVLQEAAALVGAGPGVRLAQRGAGGTPLRQALPSFNVLLDQAGSSVAAGWRDVAVFGGTVLLVLSLLLIGVVLIGRDVAREASTSRLRADLVGGVSHELKTPLAVIRMYGETLANDPDAPREERRWYYDVIIQESERLARLIQGVLDFSRIQRGERTYALTESDLPALVREVAERYQPYLRQQAFAFEFDGGGHGCPPVNMDREAVSEALVNLIDNAVKYSSEDRYVAIRVSHLDRAVLVSVEDHGEGIAPADRPHVFGRFYRGQGRSGRGGYGLGLYLVKHTMDAHGGHIDLDSVPGRGTRFTLVFPAAQAARREEGGGGQDSGR